MGEKRVSMRQIAKECGCTVSYALNHSDQAKISSATRLRVIETAKRLNYSPARTSRGRPGRAAILVCRMEGDSLGRRTALTHLATELEDQLSQVGIPSAILTIGGLVEEWGRVQALSPSLIFILDGGSRAVAHVDPPCVQPIIFVDSDNSDPLYYKILPDYPSLFRLAALRLGREDLFLVSEPVRSGQLLTGMTQGIPPEDVFLHDGTGDLRDFLARHQGRAWWWATCWRGRPAASSRRRTWRRSPPWTTPPSSPRS